MESIILAVLRDRERCCDPQKCLISQPAALKGGKSCQEAFSHPLTSYQGFWAHSVCLSRKVCHSGTPWERLCPLQQLHPPQSSPREKLSPPTCPPLSARCIRPRDVPREAVLPSQAGPFLGVLRIIIEGHGQIRWVLRVLSSLRALEKQGPHLWCCPVPRRFSRV